MHLFPCALRLVIKLPRADTEVIYPQLEQHVRVPWVYEHIGHTGEAIMKRTASTSLLLLGGSFGASAFVHGTAGQRFSRAVAAASKPGAAVAAIPSAAGECSSLMRQMPRADAAGLLTSRQRRTAVKVSVLVWIWPLVYEKDVALLLGGLGGKEGCAMMQFTP